jgi:outer membrane murein-binding lipoprotein Lpp
MPSIRDSLQKQDQPAPKAELHAQGIAQSQGLAQQQDELTQRILQSQELKIALAKAEITRQQARVDQLSSQIQDLEEQQLPPGQLSTHLNQAKSKLSEAKDDLARAEEAKLNTQHTLSPAEEHQQENKNSIRNALGRKPDQHTQKPTGPRLR